MERALAARLGPDLAGLVARLGTPIVHVREVTGLRSRTLSRATFQITLADGRSVKGRRLDSTADAERIATLVALLEPESHSRVLAQEGAAVLEEWVDGEPLRLGDAEPEDLRTCGRMLAALHSVALPAGMGGPSPTAAAIQRSLLAGIRELIDAGVLGRGKGRVLEGFAIDGAPPRVSAGLIHRDLWPANVVRTTAGTLRIVDNGNVTVGAHELDLARTRYLWPMGAAGWAAFLAGYRSLRDPADHERHSTWWQVVTLVDIACFRRGARTAGRRLPVDRLRALAAP